MGELSLRQIVERCQQGDEQAFGLLYTTMHDRLRSVCRHFTADEATADDLLHDSFILILSKITTLKDASKAEAWMTTVTRNLAQAWLQRQKQDPTVSLDRLQPSMDAAAPVPMAVTYDEILHMVDALPASYRRVFRLSVLEGMSHQEIAALLGIEPHTSSAQLSRAKLLLRRWLRPMVLLLIAAALPLGWLWHRMKEEVRGEREETVASQAAVAKSVERSTEHVAVAAVVGGNGADRADRANGANGANGANEANEADRANRADEANKANGANRANRTNEANRANETYRANEPTSHRWTVELAYSGMGGDGDLQLPYADADTNADVYESVVHHRMPLTVTLSVGYRIDRHWQLGLGLQYIRLTSEMQSGNTYAQLIQHQRVQYLGLPLSVRWHYPLTRRLGTYATANVTLQLPLHSTLDSRYMVNGVTVETAAESLRPGLQWSAGVGLGLQYDLSPTVGFFVEPSLQYHFRNHSGVETWQTEHPAALSVPFGLRITF